MGYRLVDNPRQFLIDILTCKLDLDKVDVEFVHFSDFDEVYVQSLGDAEFSSIPFLLEEAEDNKLFVFIKNNG